MDTAPDKDPSLWSRVLDEGSDGSVPAEVDGTEWNRPQSLSIWERLAREVALTGGHLS